MAKSLLMRPSWVCLKLCDSDTISATLLADIIYRSFVTIYKKHDNPVIVYSLEEWADNTGLSINQVRKALKRLALLKIVKAYNKNHPFKNVLRALHVEVPKGVSDLYHYLTSGGYRYEGDILCLSKDKDSGIKLHVSSWIKAPHVCANALCTQDASICAEEAHFHIYSNKKNNDKAVSANNAETFILAKKEESKQVEEGMKQGLDIDIPYSLEIIKTLPSLLIDLHEHYIKYHLTKLPSVNKFDFNAHDAGKLWLHNIQVNYGEYAMKPLSPKEYALLKMMLSQLDKIQVAKLIEKVTANWNKFVKCVSDFQAAWKIPATPDIGFLFYYRQHAIHLFLYKLQSYSDYW